MRKITFFIIKPTLAEEALESWIWTNDRSVASTTIIVRNPTAKKKIIIYKRTMDENFVKLYNSHNTNKIIFDNTTKYLVISEYFRDQLEIRKNEKIELEIFKANIFQRLFATSVMLIVN